MGIQVLIACLIRLNQISTIKPLFSQLKQAEDKLKNLANNQELGILNNIYTQINTIEKDSTNSGILKFIPEYNPNNFAYSVVSYSSDVKKIEKNRKKSSNKSARKCKETIAFGMHDLPTMAPPASIQREVQNENNEQQQFDIDAILAELTSEVYPTNSPIPDLQSITGLNVQHLHQHENKFENNNANAREVDFQVWCEDMGIEKINPYTDVDGLLIGLESISHSEKGKYSTVFKLFTLGKDFLNQNNTKSMKQILEEANFDGKIYEPFKRNTYNILNRANLTAITKIENSSIKKLAEADDIFKFRIMVEFMKTYNFRKIFQCEFLTHVEKRFLTKFILESTPQQLLKFMNTAEANAYFTHAKEKLYLASIAQWIVNNRDDFRFTIYPAMDKLLEKIRGVFGSRLNLLKKKEHHDLVALYS